MLVSIKESLIKILEGGGVIVNMFYSATSDEEEPCDEMAEELYDVKVKDGKIQKTPTTLDPDIERNNIKDNSSLRKARLKAHTPQAKMKREKSMMVRRRHVDKDM